jgi:uncharacterized membrane protein
MKQMRVMSEEERQEEQKEDNPALSKIIARNIRTIINLHQQTARERSTQDRIADAITCFSGTLAFLYMNMLWFGVWVLLNTGHVGVRPFDPYPYGLLTMVVSLEAIVLSLLVLISQNRLSMQAEHRANLDLHIGLLTEHELTRVLQLLHAIQDKMGIESDESSLLADRGLEMETRPEDVLAEIERLQARADRREKSGSGARQRCLLYVEDNPANLRLVERLVARRPDLRLLTAVNGDLGIEYARASQPDVILMDINLPGISGIEALKILREDAATAHIPVVAISANALLGDIEKGLEAGFFRYLTKPIKVTEFMDTLDVALEFAEHGVRESQ